MTINSLLAEKKELISKNKPTRKQDLQLYQAGVLPVALIKYSNNENTISFDLFRDYSKTNTSNVENRLRQMFPSITQCTIDYNSQTCSFTFSGKPDTTETEQLVKIFSYNGYTIKK